MLLFSLTALTIFISILIIHYKNHFQLIIFKRHINDQPKRDFAIKPIDKDAYNFFPMSFVFYNIFFVFLCVINTIIGVTSFATRSHNDSISVLLFGLDLTQNITTSTLHTEIYVLMYGIMLSSIWDNLHAFHRYYSIYKTKHLKSVSSRAIFKKYAIYATIFALLFLVQIHLFYWIFPIITCLNFIFNIYCNYQFTQMLIVRYNASKSETNPSNDDTKFVQKANFLWKASLICCIIQSLSLGLCLGVYKYNPNILYCLPLFWCISSAIYSTSFVRNRRFLKKQCIFIFTKEIKKAVFENTKLPVPKPKIKVGDNSMELPAISILELTNNKSSGSLTIWSNPSPANITPANRDSSTHSSPTVVTGSTVPYMNDAAAVQVQPTAGITFASTDSVKTSRGTAANVSNTTCTVNEQSLPSIPYINIVSIEQVNLNHHENNTLQSLKEFGFV